MCIEGLPIKAWNENWELAYLSLPLHVGCEWGVVGFIRNSSPVTTKKHEQVL